MAIHSLHIGINNYRGSADLQGCVNDAQDLAEVFAAANTQTLLLDRKASRRGVLRALRALLAKLRPKDLGIVTFSGHGTYVPDELGGDEADGRDEALVCADLRPIYDDEFQSLLTARDPASRLCVITDACHSGTIHRAFLKKRPDRAVRFLPARTMGVLRSVLAPRRPLLVGPLPNVVHFAGCRDSEFAYDAEFNGRPNGAMTHYLTTTYRMLAVKTFGQWFEQLSACLPSAEYPQTPCCNASKAALRWPLPKGRLK